MISAQHRGSCLLSRVATLSHAPALQCCCIHAQAVVAAVEYVANATGVDAATLAELGVVDQLLSYHVAPGAALVMERLVNGQVLTMLDGNTTTIVTCAAASRSPCAC